MSSFLISIFRSWTAPWCGHCKQMAPTLDKMAPYISGKMAIGKIDCTTEKNLCKKHGIRGYPTLKIYRDGDFFDYPGRRDADSSKCPLEIIDVERYSVGLTNATLQSLNSQRR